MCSQPSPFAASLASWLLVVITAAAGCVGGELQSSGSQDTATSDDAAAGDAAPIPDGTDDLDTPACVVTLSPVTQTSLSLVTGASTPLTVRVDDACEGPVDGALVAFSLAGATADASLSAAQATTEESGVATVTLTAGVEGELTVSASHADQQVQFLVAVTSVACAGHCQDSQTNCGETGQDCGGACTECTNPCAGHCNNGVQDCGEVGQDCGGGECLFCGDPCTGHCQNGAFDCGEEGQDCGGECAACGGPCAGHCGNDIQDCGETGVDCGGECSGCTPSCTNHCADALVNCGETGLNCGGECAACSGDDGASVSGHTLPASIACEETVYADVTLQNTGTTTWYRDGVNGYKLGYVGDLSHPFLPQAPANVPRVMLDVGETVAPGSSVTFSVPLHAPTAAGPYSAQFQMVLEGAHWFGEIASASVDVTGDCEGGGGPCRFPQGVPDEAYEGHTGNDAAIAAAVNDVMAGLSGCSIGSDCPIGDEHPTAQSWFDAVNSELRGLGYCAGQHEEGHTDEIAVSSTGCEGSWYGYHIYNYGGSKVVWNPGAQRDYWTIDPAYCP